MKKLSNQINLRKQIKPEPGLNKEEKNIEQVSDSSKKMHNDSRFTNKSPEDKEEYLKAQKRKIMRIQIKKAETIRLKNQI